MSDALKAIIQALRQVATGKTIMTQVLDDVLRTYVLVTSIFTFGAWPFLLPTVFWIEYGPGVGLPLALAHLIGYCRGYRLLGDWRV